MLSRREFLSFRFFGRSPAPLLLEGPEPGKFSLRDLPRLGDDILVRIVPVLRRGWSAQLGDSGLIFRGDAGQEGVLPLDTGSRAAFALFDGERTLGQVASILEARQGVAKGRGIAVARTAFLILALNEVYHPGNPPG
jgi:hypothetical protein